MRPGQTQIKTKAETCRNKVRTVQQESSRAGQRTGLQGHERKLTEHANRRGRGTGTEETKTYVFVYVVKKKLDRMI